MEEILMLFEDWFEELEEEIISLIKVHGTLNPEKLADKTGLSLRGRPFSFQSSGVREKHRT